MATSSTWSDRALAQQPPPSLQPSPLAQPAEAAPLAGNGAGGHESAGLAAEGDAARPGYHWETSAMLPLAISGGVTLGASYGVTTLVAWFIPSCRGDSCAPFFAHGGGWVFMPVVGPFIAMTTADPTPDTLDLITLGAFGTAQVAGLGMLIAGVTMRETELVRDEPVRVAPMVGATMAGVSLAGDF